LQTHRHTPPFKLYRCPFTHAKYFYEEAHVISPIRGIKEVRG